MIHYSCNLPSAKQWEKNGWWYWTWHLVVYEFVGNCEPSTVVWQINADIVAETRLDARAKPKQLRKWVEVGDERREADQRRSQAEAGVEANTCSQ